MPNSAKQAKQRAEKILAETEKYVNGIKDGKKILYHVIEQWIKELQDSIREVNRSIGEMDNILPQYGDTPKKATMLELHGRLEDRERFLRSRLYRNF